eukprot:6241005-Alexandrium_andersonii.AAC.1
MCIRDSTGPARQVLPQWLKIDLLATVLDRGFSVLQHTPTLHPGKASEADDSAWRLSQSLDSRSVLTRCSAQES